MAQYFQVIEQNNKTTANELQTIYPNIVEGQQTVSYVLNSEDHPLPQNQQIIVAGEQYMVLDNVIDQSTIKFQTRQFEVQQAPQQIYYMESEDGVQTVETIQMAQPVVLNHQIQGVTVTQPTSSPQKLIMQQHGQPAVVIQQPQLVQRQVPVTTTIQLPVQKRSIQQSPRPSISSPQLTLTPRTSLTQNANRLNVIRGALPRTTPISSPADSLQQANPNTPRPLVPRGGVVQRTVRGGVIQTSTPRAVVMQGTPRPPKQLVQKKKIPDQIQATISPRNIDDLNSIDAVALADGRVISVAEYQLIMANRKKAMENQLNTIKPLPAKGPLRAPLRRPPIRQTPRPNPEVTTPPQVVPGPSSFPQQKTLNTLLQPPLTSTTNSVVVQTSPPPKPLARIIQPQNQDNSRLPAILRNFVPPPEIKHIISKTQHTPEFNNSIRMFVLLANGEQRLITFTMPKEDCTIQEILEQVGVPLQPDTKIAISETNADGINLVVTVGITDENESELMQIEERPQTPDPVPPREKTPPLPEFPVLAEPEAPRYVSGKLAVCMHCGFLSDDFNKCIRCKSKLPDDIKAVPSLNMSRRVSDMHKKPTIAIHLKSNGNAKSTPVKKKPRPKPVEQEPVILTLSSDDEAEDEENTTSSLDQLMKEPQSTETFSKEPTIHEIKDSVKGKGKDESNEDTTASISLFCRTVRIGSYRFSPPENVLINNREIIIRVPNPADPNDVKTVTIERENIVKVLVNFQKILPVVFYYLTPTLGATVRKELNMTEGSEYYFDPVSEEEAFKRITLLPETISEESKSVFKIIYGSPFNIMDELNPKETNQILVRTCPKEVTKCIPLSSSNTSASLDVRQILIYPPGKGGLSINTEDYLCLAQDQFLNDVIIDFYLKYLVMNLPVEQQVKVHVFSTFFYKRLTTKPTKPTRKSHPTELDSNLTAAQKRHCRVKNWTKNVNLFEKDYIIVPINENAHWFLAIICFASMNGPHTLDGKPHTIEVRQRKKKIVATIGSVMITQVKVEKQPPVLCDDADLSDKDEAEGDESELDSGEESEELPATAAVVAQPRSKTRVPIHQPCILIFDSLAGASRSRVVATLRDYLTCEHKVKLGTVKVYNKDIIKGACPKVPQQTNYTDCGLYLLQYVESFFTAPIKDFHIPINELKGWFEEIVVTRKREEISNLIKELMGKYQKDVGMLPNIIFPTLNGELVENPPEEEEEEETAMEEEEEEDEGSGKDVPDTEGSDKLTDSESSVLAVNGSQDSEKHSPVKTMVSPEPFVAELVSDEAPRPDLPKPSNRDTMSYLKSKRIIRHKTTGGTCEYKKMKMD